MSIWSFCVIVWASTPPNKPQDMTVAQIILPIYLLTCLASNETGELALKNPCDRTKQINVRLIRRIQRMILNHPEAFDMGTLRGRTPIERQRGMDNFSNTTPLSFDPKTMRAPSCGSACCIAGWASVLATNEPLSETVKKEQSRGIIWDNAEKALGLTPNQADGIFHWQGDHDSMDDVTATEAAAMLDEFIKNPRMFEI
jgi:hypothetical protein